MQQQSTLSPPRFSTGEMERRQASFLSRMWWELRHGRWGLLLLLACHQLVVALVLLYGIIFLDDDGLPVPLPALWPFVFLLGSLGAFDIFVRRLRSRVSLCQALMLTAYGSRAMAVLLGAVANGWSTSALVGIASWVVYMAATQRAWTEARSVL